MTSLKKNQEDMKSVCEDFKTKLDILCKNHASELQEYDSLLNKKQNKIEKKICNFLQDMFPDIEIKHTYSAPHHLITFVITREQFTQLFLIANGPSWDNIRIYFQYSNGYPYFLMNSAKKISLLRVNDNLSDLHKLVNRAKKISLLRVFIQNEFTRKYTILYQ